MFKFFITAAIAGSFASPAPLSTPGPKFAQQKPKIEAVVAQGHIYELTVRCSVGTTIVSYSKIEGLYCTQQGSCGQSLKVAVVRGCGAF